jgi:hypothetical protein
MRIKRVVLRPDRLRRVPPQFSWIDQRLVREHYIERCDAGALALYLFLVTVADAQGLSYYGEAKLTKSLSMSAQRLGSARARLIELDLIAYEAPLYQVLALGTPATAALSPPCDAGITDLHKTLDRIRAAFTEPSAAAKKR